MKNVLLSLLLVLAGVCSGSAEPKKIVLIAGPLDDHALGTHEYENNVLLLKHCLQNSFTNVHIETHFGGWPADPGTLDSANTIVMTSGGSDRKETDHPLYVADRFAQLEKQMNRGCGLVMFHWSVFHPHRHHDKITDWLGGYFDYETGAGGPTQKWFSQIQHATWPVLPNPNHPVTRGIAQFTLSEEFYFNMRFRDNHTGLTPVLWKETNDKKENVIAWAVERQNGGRGFGFTGGHFYTNWWVPEFRKVVLNGIAWTAGLEVPPRGAEGSLAEFKSPESRKVAPPAAAGVPSEPAKPAKKIKPTTGVKDSGATAKEEAWKDNRWNQMDVGQMLASIIPLPNGRIVKGLSVRVGKDDEASICYDTATCNLRAGWLSGFLKFDPARFGLINSPSVTGEPQFLAPADEAWSGKARYQGLYLNGKRVFLEYEVSGAKVFDSPWFEEIDGTKVFTRAMEVEKLSGPERLTLIETLAPLSQVQERSGTKFVSCTKDDTVLLVAMTGDAQLVTAGQRIGIEFPANKPASRVKIFVCTTAATQVDALLAALNRPAELESLANLHKSGPPRWGPAIVTRGEVSPISNEPFVVDTIAAPYENPSKALMFLSGVDFFSNGDAAVCSIHGDVWRVSGIDDRLQNIQWKRFATGLFQPLGLKIVDDKIHVLGRDQITILHDRNNDGEADFYECFSNAIHTSPAGHDYVTSLERDQAGNFYYVCPKGVHRVSKDGREHETLAAGFRNPNGMGISPDGIITVAPQEGEWTPSSAICEIKPGGFYGYGGPQITSQRPLGYDAPLCWIPRMIDSSSGSQVWVTSDRWGPLKGHMLNLSFGRCSMMLVLREVVNGQAQGGVVPLKPRFLSGVMRGAFRSQDGQLYLVGSHGWSTSATRDGCFQRVRFTGKKVYLPLGINVLQNGIRLTFSEPLETETAEDAGSYGIEQWNYRYTQNYGSKEYSVASPSEEGHDEVEIKSAKLLADGKTVFLEIPGLQPVMQMQIQYNLNAADGKTVKGEIYNTINQLGE